MNSKLRFYLRGLGIGIVVTALILTAVNLKNNRGEMTDAEIRQRAAELGMVEGSSYSLIDATADREIEETAEEKPEEVSEEKTEEVSEQTSENTEENLEDTENKEEELTEVTPEEQVAKEEKKEEKKEEPEEQVTEEKKEEPVAEVVTEKEPEPEPTEVPATGEAITISIHSGAASETAASILKNAGLITDATDFNAYMMQNGYDRRIHPGTYTINMGATYEEICKIIAG